MCLRDPLDLRSPVPFRSEVFPPSAPVESIVGLHAGMDGVYYLSFVCLRDFCPKLAMQVVTESLNTVV